ncbi:hypothetical protein B0A48_15875 [Cryoendolithus antarcticus]|uniref:Uncharacterized protein n=1 Tax=Cryoendolithus antarcticus TaxID=1507870 RepID=A0A1V8SHJ6_9PEZI|nr:hypothetical protein B0A48_15875 [Cryoendolithus antarcticus]
MPSLDKILPSHTFDASATASDEMIASDLAEMRKLVSSSPGPDPCAVPGLQGIFQHSPRMVAMEVKKQAEAHKQQRDVSTVAVKLGRIATQTQWNEQHWLYIDAGGLESEERAFVVAAMPMSEKLAIAKQVKLAEAAAKTAARKEKAAAAAAARKEKAEKLKAAAAAAAASRTSPRKRKADVLTEDAEPVTGNRKSARVKAPTERRMEASQVTPAALKTTAGKGKGKGKTTITRLRVTPPALEQTKPILKLKLTRGANQTQIDDSTSTNNLLSSPPPDVRMSIDFMLSSATSGGSMSNKLLPPLAASDGSMSNNIVQSALPRDVNVSTDPTSERMDGTSQSSLGAGTPAPKRRKTTKKSRVGATSSNTQPPTSSSSGDHVSSTLPSGTPSDTTKSLRHTSASSKSTTDTSYTSSLNMPRPETEADYTSPKPRTRQPARASIPAPLPSASLSAPQPSATSNGRRAHGHGHAMKLKRSTPANASAFDTSFFTSSPPPATTPAKKRSIDAIDSIEEGDDDLPLKKVQKREKTPYPTSAERKRKHPEEDESSGNESSEDEQESDEEYAVDGSPARKKTKRTSSNKGVLAAKTPAKQPKGANNKVAKKAPTYKLPKDYVGVKSGHGHSTIPPVNADLKVGEQWRCGNLDCDSGMTWYDDDEYRRKSISNFFGRNKTATKRIDDAVWHILCRRCYQDGYTPHAKKPEKLMDLAHELTKLICQQLERIQLWRPDATFSFDLHKTAKDRMHKWTTLLATHGDKAVALKLMPPVTVSKSQNKPIVEEMFPSEYAVDFMTTYVNNGKKDYSFDDVENMLKWSLERVGKNKSPCITPFEILLNEEVRGETINDTTDNFKQWEDLQAEKQDAAEGH